MPTSSRTTPTTSSPGPREWPGRLRACWRTGSSSRAVLSSSRSSGMNDLLAVAGPRITAKKRAASRPSGLSIISSFQLELSPANRAELAAHLLTVFIRDKRNKWARPDLNRSLSVPNAQVYHSSSRSGVVVPLLMKLTHGPIKSAPDTRGFFGQRNTLVFLAARNAMHFVLVGGVVISTLE